MPFGVMEMTLKEWFQMGKEQERQMAEWERNRVIKRCSCGSHYSYEKGDIDPEECPACRGDEGELIY